MSSASVTSASDRRYGAMALLAPAGVLFALAYVLPLALLAWGSLHRGGEFSAANYAELFASPAFGLIVWRTIKLAAIVTLLSLVIGYPMAYALARVRGPLLGILLLMVTVPYLTSVLIRSYAWVVVLGGNGIANRTLMSLGLIERPLKLVFNDFGTYLGMVQIQLPLMILPLFAAMRKVDPALTAAGRSLGSSPAGAFWHVFLPLSAPGIGAGTILVFLSCLGFYVTPALLGNPGEYLIAQAIEVRVSMLSDFPAAAAQATMLLCVILVVAAVFRRSARAAFGADGDPQEKRVAGIADAGLGLRHQPGWRSVVERTARRPLAWFGAFMSAVRWPLLWAHLALGILFLVAPMIVVVPLAFSDASYLAFPPPAYSLRWVRAYLGNAQWLSATGFSLWISFVSAGLALVVGGAAAFGLDRGGFAGKQAFRMLLVSPLIVPHMVVAIALFFILAPLRLTGNPIGFVLAYVLLAVPYVVVIVAAGLKRFDRSLEMAAASLGASQVTTLRTVTLPLLLPTIISAFGFAFLSAFDDLVVALFFSSPTATTLSMRMWDDIRQEISPMIAVVAVLMLVLVIASAIAGALLRPSYSPRTKDAH